MLPREAHAVSRHRLDKVGVAITGALEWYFESRRENWNAVPFYCDVAKIGTFAVSPQELARGTDAALFRLFVTMSMYQARRDVVIMRQQHSMPRSLMRTVADMASVNRSIARHDCRMLLSTRAFDAGCDVFKNGGVVDCGTRPGADCHVKDATVAFHRMGDMGKLPTSAWLRFWKDGGMQALLAEVCSEETSPKKRAQRVVARFATVHRVGRKLATMFVSALSTPALAPGLTPWFPEVDGNELVVVDTNVARAIDALRKPGSPKTYDKREQWVREQAAKIDLRRFHRDNPKYSPRIVQEALYAFCSKSNRMASGDICSGRTAACNRCAAAICPFVPRGHARH